MLENVSKPLTLSVKTDDKRYPIHVEVTGAETFTLYFNPGNILAVKCADELQSLDFPDGNDSTAVIEFANKVEENLDAIFGKGATQLIFRYESYDYTLMSAVLEKVREGQSDFAERAEAAQRAAKTQAVIDAKKEGAAYSMST